jgi:DNA/RNA endonuclease YhcR with UshA esterase domain
MFAVLSQAPDMPRSRCAPAAGRVFPCSQARLLGKYRQLNKSRPGGVESFKQEIATMQNLAFPTDRNRSLRAAAGTTVLLTGFFVSVLCTILAPQAAGSLFAADARFAVKVSPADTLTIGSITDSMLNSTVEIEATIAHITPPREGSRAPYRVRLSDQTGQINLIIWPDSFEVLKTRLSPAVGDLIRVRAQVTQFRGEIQLTLRDVDNLRVLSRGTGKPGAPSVPGPAAALTPLASINESMMGQYVTVQGTINHVRPPGSERAPYIVTLVENDATMPMVFWSDVHSAIAKHLRVGNVIRVRAQVSEHRGSLQLRLRNARDFELVSPGAAGTENSSAAPSEQQQGPVEIGRIRQDWAEREVTVAGQIAVSDNLGRGQRLRVRDETGEIQVILWENVLSGLPVAELQSGRAITVTGRLKLYRGQLELVPSRAEQVRLAAQ